jgi:hypothetical protein
MPENWDVANPGYLAELQLGAIVEQTGDSERLAIFQLDFSFGTTSGKSGNSETGYRESVTEVKRAHLGSNVHANDAVFADETGEVESHTKRTKLDGDRSNV